MGCGDTGGQPTAVPLRSGTQKIVSAFLTHSSATFRLLTGHDRIGKTTVVYIQMIKDTREN